jgi:hypothetical protein
MGLSAYTGWTTLPDLSNWADVNSSDFNPQTCKLLRRINPSLSGKWQIAPVVCSVPERINPSVGAYYFDTRVGMYSGGRGK